MFILYATSILACCIFGDKRLERRFGYLVQRLGEGFGKSIPQSFIKRSEVKAAYNFFKHPRMEYHMIVSAERARLVAQIEQTLPPVVLCVQDTTDLDYTGSRSSAKLKHLQYEYQKGYYLHNHLMLDAQGNGLGIIDQYLWGREGEGLGSLKQQRKQRPYEEKESFRWLEQFDLLQDSFGHLGQTLFIDIADQEADIHELLQGRRHDHVHYIIRSRGDRSAHQSTAKVVDLIAGMPQQVAFEIEVTDDKTGKKRKALMAVRSGRQVIKASFRQKGHTPVLPTEVGIVLAQEICPPAGTAEPLEWVLFTSLPLDSVEDAMQVIHWYMLRWRIEVFHYILKQGCSIEKLQLKEPTALQNAIATYSLLSMQILQLRYWQDAAPEAPMQASGFDVKAYRAAAIYLNRWAGASYDTEKKQPTVADFIKVVGQLAGNMLWKNRPIGVKHLWTGLRELQVILNAFEAFDSG